MKSTFKRILIGTALALTSAGTFAHAAPPSGGGSPRPDARPPRPERPHMTPEERRKQTEDKMRNMMANNGVTDGNTQDAVLAYLTNELEARRPLRQIGIKLQRALSDENTTDDQIKAIIADYENVQNLENQRRTQAQSDLDKAIQYSQNPRLQGLLMLMGVLGDGPPLMVAPRDNRREGNNRPNPNKGRGEGNPEMRKKIMEQFDKNNDGKLDAEERAAIQAYRQQQANK